MTMFRTLFSRIALTLFVLLFSVGILLVQMIRYNSTLYHEEVSQKLNIDLAKHIVSDHSLIMQGQVNDQILEGLFHNLMVINPSIELYILDTTGKVLGYYAPEGKVKRDTISLTPIRTFLQGNIRFPLKGDDPRDLSGQKVFSAAEIKTGDRLQGYLYIVLASEQYQNVAAMIEQSYTLDASLMILLSALFITLLGGMLIFAVQTRRLRLLGSLMQQYSTQQLDEKAFVAYPVSGHSKDEIDQLGAQFNAMAQKISQQVRELKRMDNMRREMVANVSHDLRTPLTTLRGYLETWLIHRNEISEQEQLQYIKTALSHSEHLGRLIEELFELARLDSCESVVFAEPFSMCELVQDVVQKYQLQAEQKNIQLQTRLNPEAPMIYGDIAMMQRVLENLLDNGLRHTPQQGRITISVDIDSSAVVVKISDTGCGIPEQDIPRIFERFYQRDVNRSQHKNAGLGLAIVHRILELHHSAIQVNSELNQGTTFSFQLQAKSAM